MDEYIDQLSDSELQIKMSSYQKQAKTLLAMAARCQRILIARDAVVMLATAKKAVERARTGICTNGIGDCQVHQMGSCKGMNTL